MSPRTPEQFDAIRSQRIRQIKDAALRLFARDGYANTSISKIAREVGMSKGLLYNYFSSKEDLLAAILEDGFAFAAALIEEVRAMSDPVERLRLVIERTFDHVAANADYWRLYTSLAFQPAANEVAGRMMEAGGTPQIVFEFTVDAFRQMQHPDPESEAWLLSAAIDGIFMHYLQIGEDYPLEKMKRYMLERFLNVLDGDGGGG